MNLPDLHPVRAFLGDAYAGFAATVRTYAERSLAARHEPEDDAAARVEARALLGALVTLFLFQAFG